VLERAKLKAWLANRFAFELARRCKGSLNIEREKAIRKLANKLKRTLKGLQQNGEFNPAHSGQKSWLEV
jgi:hypothetical protein